MNKIDKDLLDQELNEDVLENVNGGNNPGYGSDHGHEEKPELPYQAVENMNENASANDPK